MSSVIRPGSSRQKVSVVPLDGRGSSDPGSGVIEKAQQVVAQKGHGEKPPAEKPAKSGWAFGSFNGPPRDSNPGGLTRPNGVGSTSFGEG